MRTKEYSNVPLIDDGFPRRLVVISRGDTQGSLRALHALHGEGLWGVQSLHLGGRSSVITSERRFGRR